MSLGPQAIRIGKVEDRHRLTEVRRLCGQLTGGPSGVFDQSIERISAPISPPPDSQLNSSFTAGWGDCESGMIWREYLMKR